MAPQGVPGQVDSALHFNGSQGINLPAGSLTAGHAEVTLAFWVKPDAWPNDALLYGERGIAAFINM